MEGYVSSDQIELKTVPWFQATHIPTGVKAYGPTPSEAESNLRAKLQQHRKGLT
jgi:hypothetical protein